MKTVNNAKSLNRENMVPITFFMSSSSAPITNSLLMKKTGQNEYQVLRGAMAGISVIFVKKITFILLNKFNLHTIIYDSLKFQTSITVVRPFMKQYVNFCDI